MSVPARPDSRFDRGTVERIIQRAAELQASEREIGDELSETDLLTLGRDVGIPERHLRQALLEEQARLAHPAEHGLLTWLAGPRLLAAARVVGKPRQRLETELHRWMVEGELLQVKRRYPDQTTWEPQQGAFASLKRAFRAGGRRYRLARAREVAGQVLELEQGRCYVQLLVDVSNTFGEYVGGAATIGIAGALTTGVAFAIGVIAPVALAPAALALPIALAVARSHRRRADEYLVAIEQILDRLEHGELDAHKALAPGAASPLARIADEIRRTLGA